MVRKPDGILHLYAADEASSRPWTDYIERHRHGQIYIPHPAMPDDFLLSRFLAKVALEVLASQLAAVDDGLELVATDVQLDPLRNFARFGTARVWPFHRRELYAPDTPFCGEDGEPYEVLHEFALLYTKERDLYLVCAIYGVEYAINLGGPEIDGYTTWLEEHDGRSYLDLLEPNRASSSMSAYG